MANQEASLLKLADYETVNYKSFHLLASIFLFTSPLRLLFISPPQTPLRCHPHPYIVIAVSTTPETAMAPPDENATDNTAENHLRFDEPKFDNDAEGGRKQSGVEHKSSIYAKPDLENGEEYANLVAYISSYYEGPRRKSVVSMEAGDVKKPWWKFWARGPKAPGGGDGTLEIPDDVSCQQTVALTLY